MPPELRAPTHVLTLMAAPGTPALTEDLIASLHGIVGDTTNLKWLCAGQSIDIPLYDRSNAEIEALRGQIADGLLGRQIDWFLAPAKERRKHLLVADMESTMIAEEMLEELAAFIGLRDQVADITGRAMDGALDFEAAILERVALLEGIEAKLLDELAETHVTYMSGARELIATMKANGAYCALVSGGFTSFTARVAEELGFDEHRANTLEIVDGKLTGRVVPPILGRDAKRKSLDDLTDKLGLDLSQAIAVGDGANDIDMLRAAGLGVAYHAKPRVRDAIAATENGAVIDHCDLSALLYVQGYTTQDIVRS
ncbi:MAG: phosphoserine phosphatase SerB [Pseudomonadota bacterium]